MAWGLLAGCVGQAPGCASVAVPRLQPGQYEYALEGWLHLLPENYPIVAFPSGKVPDGGFPAGSKLTLAIGAAEERPWMDGSLRRGAQATYWLYHAGLGEWSAAVDEWVDLEDGVANEAVLRSFQATPGGSLHRIDYTNVAHPPLLLAGLLAGTTIDAGTSAAFAVPAELPLPGEPPADGSFALHVEGIEPAADGTCTALVTARWDDPIRLANAAVQTIHYKLGTASAFPLEYQNAYVLADGSQPAKDYSFRLTLERQAPAGDPLPTFHPRARPTTTLPMAVPSNGFLDGEAPGFPTTLQAAVDAATPYLAAWRGGHADAKPSAALHRMGPSGSTILDSWALTWSAPDGSAIVATVTAERDPAGLLPARLTVTTAEGLHPPPREGARPRLEAMANVARHIHGAVEFLDCDFAMDVCQWGTHAGVGALHAGEQGSEVRRAGAMVWLAKGWLLQEDSLAAAAIGPPVPRSGG